MAAEPARPEPVLCNGRGHNGERPTYRKKKNKNKTAWLFERIYQNSKHKLVKGLFCLTPFPGMKFIEESSHDLVSCSLGSAFPRCPLGGWLACRGREKWAELFRHQGFCHAGIKSPTLFLLPRRTSCTHTFTRCPLLAPLAGLGVSHKPSGSVLLSL